MVMAKSSNVQKQEDEMKILTALQNNANENIDTIAKQVGLSKQKVSRMIKQMEENQVIWGYTAITTSEKFNQKQFMMFIKRTYDPLDKKIMDKIDSLQLEDLALPLGVTIESSCYVHGNYDWVISFLARDINQAKTLCNLLYKEFPEVIAQVDIQQILYYARKNYIFNPNRKKLLNLMH